MTGPARPCVAIACRTRSAFLAFPTEPGVMRAFPDFLACDFAQSRS